MNHSKHSKMLLLAALLASLLLFAACGSAPSNLTAVASAPATAEAYAPEQPAAGAETGDAGTGMLPSTATGPSLTQPQDGRKVILTANLTLETLQFADTCEKLQQAAVDAGGYIAATRINGGENSSYRTAAFTAKIPAPAYAGFLQTAGKTGNVIQRDESSSDVTAQMVDIEARLAALKTQETRLLELMKEAGTLEDLLTVQQKLTEVQYEIESYTTTRRSLENLVAYSTVEISVNEVQTITEIPPETYASKASAAFTGTWKAVGKGIQEIGLALIWLLPLLTLLAVLALILLPLLRHNAKKRAQNHPTPNYPPYPQPTQPENPTSENNK